MKYVLEVVEEGSNRPFYESYPIDSDSAVPIPEVGEVIHFDGDANWVRVVERKYWYSKALCKVQLVCAQVNPAESA